MTRNVHILVRCNLFFISWKQDNTVYIQNSSQDNQDNHMMESEPLWWQWLTMLQLTSGFFSTHAPEEVWQEFLCIDDNKVELLSFLASWVAYLDTGKQILSTHHAEFLCTQSWDTSGCTLYTLGGWHPHLAAFKRCYEGRVHQGINVHSRHRCVRVTVALLNNTTELWVAFGSRKVLWHLVAHELAKTLGPDLEWWIALPMSHIYTGCGNLIVSSFCC